jgi:hypothetical protein
MDVESELRLLEDAAAVAAYLGERDGVLTAGWAPVAPTPGDEPGVFWLSMIPRSAPGEMYYARVAWTVYPGSPPSVRFVTAVRGALDSVSAWPSVPGYRPSSFDICMAFTREGYQTHPEWVTQYPWPTSGNPFLWVAQTLQGHLDRSYAGRAA